VSLCLCGILFIACEFTEQAEDGPQNPFLNTPPIGFRSISAASTSSRRAACVETISSQALAEQFHLNAAQIRKDLAYFGEFGVRGVGYYVKDLKRHLRQILGLDRKLRVAVMGAGNLGLALADYPGFKREGFEIVSMFDVADTKIGDESRSGVPIHDLRS
jgi:redox-sensing transcriptional repressor